MSWGNWDLNVGNACLEFNDPQMGMIYQIPVDEISTSAEVLDWIYQVEEKTWASDVDVGHLVSAMREILGRGIAGGGLDNPVDAKSILSRRYGIKFP